MDMCQYVCVERELCVIFILSAESLEGKGIIKFVYTHMVGGKEDR